MFFQLNSYNLGIGIITPIFSWRNWGFERLSSLFADNRYWLKWLNLSRIIQLLSNKTGNRTPRSRLSSWPRYLKRTGSLAPNYYRLTTCNPTLNFTTNIPRWNYFFFFVLKNDQLHYKHESGGFLCALQVRKSVNVSLCVDAVECRLFKISFEQTLPWGLICRRLRGQCSEGLNVAGVWLSFQGSGLSGPRSSGCWTFLGPLPVLPEAFALHLAQKLRSLLGIYLIHREAGSYQQACEFIFCSWPLLF